MCPAFTNMQIGPYFLPSPLVWLTSVLYRKLCIFSTFYVLFFKKAGSNHKQEGVNSPEVSEVTGKCFFLTLAAQPEGIKSQSPDTRLVLLCLFFISCSNELTVLPISCQPAIHRKKETCSNCCLQIYFVRWEWFISVCILTRRVSVESKYKSFSLFLSNNTCISKQMQGFNENRTTISLLKVSQLCAMHSQRKEPERTSD